MDKKIFDAKERIISNGINLISIKKATSLFSVHAAIKIGSLNESKDEKGIAHFVEHMLFKGTKDRANEALNEELENIGGEYNAYTDYNCTVVSVTALKEELNNALSLISDMLRNSIFPEEEVLKEREVILSEISTSKDDVEDYSFRKTFEAAYKNSPLKYDTIGNESNVKKFTREELIKFYNTFYLPNNCYISIVSPFEHEKIEKLVNDYFGDWIEKKFVCPNFIIEHNKPITKISYKKNIEQSSIVFLYTFHNLDEKLELALKIFNHKFGESNNSILFREVRERRGLAYDIYSDLDITNGVKSLYIYTAISMNKVNDTLECINNCMEKVKKEICVFDTETIALMKKVLKTSVVSTIEDTTDLGNYVLHQKIDGEDIYEFLKDMENLKNIKKEDIYNAAREVLNNPTIHILLPKESDIIGK